MNIITIRDPLWSSEEARYVWGFDLYREGFLSALEKSPLVKGDLLRMLDGLRRQIEGIGPPVPNSAAAALRSIPSARRSETSRANGAKGGRPRKPPAE